MYHQFSTGNTQVVSIPHTVVLSAFVLMRCLGTGKTEAVRLLRAECNLGLKEAKDIMDYLANHATMAADGTLVIRCVSNVSYHGSHGPYQRNTQDMKEESYPGLASDSQWPEGEFPGERDPKDVTGIPNGGITNLGDLLRAKLSGEHS